MDERARAKQIQQMVNFMKLEARDKAKEIAVKTDHDCAKEHQKLVFAAKKKLQAEFAKRAKHLEVQQRVKQSHRVMQTRMKKLIDRDSLLKEVLDGARTKVDAITASAGYTDLLTGLIVQGAKKLNTPEVEVVGRETDAAAIDSAIVRARKQLDGVVLNLARGQYIPESCGGGVVLTANDGRITCDNTLGSRLELAFHDLAPVIRHMVFPSNRAEDRKAAPAPAPATTVADVDLLLA